MVSKPRGFFTLEQRDNLLIEVHDTLIKIEEQMKSLTEKNVVCVQRIDQQDSRLDKFKNNIAAAGVAVGIALIGVIAAML